jgi:hypothetical protein
MIAKLTSHFLIYVSPVICGKVFIPHAEARLSTITAVTSFAADNLKGYLFAVDA